MSSHEDRIRALERRVSEHSDDIKRLMKWLEDHENRLALLEHFEGYDLDDVRCSNCGAPMRVKRNRQAGDYFLGCVRYRPERAIGKPVCPARPVSRRDLQTLATRLSVA